MRIQYLELQAIVIHGGDIVDLAQKAKNAFVREEAHRQTQKHAYRVARTKYTRRPDYYASSRRGWNSKSTPETIEGE